MATWEENQYVLEAKENIHNAKHDYIEAKKMFEQYAEQVKAIDPILFGWMESGYNMDQYYTEMEIDNNQDWLSDSKRSYDNRVAGAKKAAKTRMANKLKLV